MTSGYRHAASAVRDVLSRKKLTAENHRRPPIVSTATSLTRITIHHRRIMKWLCMSGSRRFAQEL